MEYIEAGRAAISRMEKLCAEAAAVQEQLLLELLSKNSRTVYGKKYDFSRIGSVKEYQTMVPVTSYDDYEEEIERHNGQETGVFAADKPIFYCISSGSTAEPKYLPLTEADISVQKTYLMDFVTGVIRREMGELSEKELFGRIFQTQEFFRTFAPDGTMSGVRSGALHRWLEARGEIREDLYTAPKEVLFPERIEDMIYVKLRFALACRDVTAIHGIFAHRMLGLFRYMVNHWNMLLKDMETGEISEIFGISVFWKEYLRKRLPPDGDRALELKRISFKEAGGELVYKIWPKVKYIRLVGGGIFETYMEELRGFIGKLPVHYYAYAASEGCFGVACDMNREDAYYTLIPEAAFFEFVPLDPNILKEHGQKRALTIWEVEQGAKYELLVTTLSGLYRYALGDVVEVTGFCGQAPIVRVCYRKNQILNIADEKMNVLQLESAMEKFRRLSGCVVRGYCADADLEGGQPRYLVYMETDAKGHPKNAEELLDKCFEESCFGYKSAREMKELERAKIIFLKEGSFEEYDRFLAKKGYRMEQNKPLRMLLAKEQRDFFKGPNIRED